MVYLSLFLFFIVIHSHSEMDRTAVKEIICAVCDTRQEVSNKCIECGTVFGKYYCSKCKFWDDKGLQKKVRTLKLEKNAENTPSPRRTEGRSPEVGDGMTHFMSLPDCTEDNTSCQYVRTSTALVLYHSTPLPRVATALLLSLLGEQDASFSLFSI